jgi:hypothetical protein
MIIGKPHHGESLETSGAPDWLIELPLSTIRKASHTIPVESLDWSPIKELPGSASSSTLLPFPHRVSSLDPTIDYRAGNTISEQRGKKTNLQMTIASRRPPRPQHPPCRVRSSCFSSLSGPLLLAVTSLNGSSRRRRCLCWDRLTDIFSRLWLCIFLTAAAPLRSHRFQRIETARAMKQSDVDTAITATDGA